MAAAQVAGRAGAAGAAGAVGAAKWGYGKAKPGVQAAMQRMRQNNIKPG
jgi:CelD/BcsL family acetyltransferase involved in cellulose biosynthesis